MSNKKLESLKKIQKIRENKQADIKDHFNYSLSSSSIKLHDDPSQYRGAKIISRKILSRI